MSTRGFIAIKNGDKITWNYLHSDNYVVGGTGEKLLRRYNDFGIAKQLVSIGDRSYLEKEEPYDDQDEIVHNCSIDTWEKVMKDSWDIEYFYLWDNGWKVRKPSMDFVDLKDFYVAELSKRIGADMNNVNSLLKKLN